MGLCNSSKGGAGIQARYTGDIGDIGKLGLLRQFASTGYPSALTGIALRMKHTTATACILATCRRMSFAPAILLCGLRWVRLSVPASEITALEQSDILAATYFGRLLHSSSGDKIAQQAVHMDWHELALQAYRAVTLSLSIPATD